MDLTAKIVAEYCQGVTSPHFNPSGVIRRVEIDSRKVSAGSLFFAIKGENTDGHNFVADVIKDGDTYAVVAADFVADLPNLIRVADPTLALGKFAASYCQLFEIPRVAITGSNGKTTVKEMLLSVCKQKFTEKQILASSGNFNNHLGMPLTLLQLNPEHAVAILEMGMNHCGELDYLAQIARPTLAAINNVMFAHAGHFDSLSDIALAKGEVFNGLGPQGVACVDYSNPYKNLWLEALTKSGTSIYAYGTESSNCFIESISATGACYQTPQGQLHLKLQVLGEHNYLNALTVIALALNLGIDLACIKSGLEQYGGYKGRLERKKSFNGAVLIDDTYNANPDSVRAALKAIQALPKPYWFIFADLKELGSREVEFHQQLAQAIQDAGISKLLTVGELARHTAAEFSGDKIHFATNQDIVKYCVSHLPAEATVLVKGSNSMRLSDVAEQLTMAGKTA